MIGTMWTSIGAFLHTPNNHKYMITIGLLQLRCNVCAMHVSYHGMYTVNTSTNVLTVL